uniref:DUF295 domain-containing protein n=1 Tax=Rhabditophanes sp. KR3021 TaxID=114890 RepID=A0AC35THI5_9BILA
MDRNNTFPDEEIGFAVTNSKGEFCFNEDLYLVLFNIHPYISVPGEACYNPKKMYEFTLRRSEDYVSEGVPPRTGNFVDVFIGAAVACLKFHYHFI